MKDCSFDKLKGMEIIITIGLVGFAIYLVIGVLFSLFFLTKGLGKIDKNAIGTGIGFKLIILPGVILLWAYLLPKWLKAKS